MDGQGAIGVRLGLTTIQHSMELGLEAHIFAIRPVVVLYWTDRRSIRYGYMSGTTTVQGNAIFSTYHIACM